MPMIIKLTGFIPIPTQTVIPRFVILGPMRFNAGAILTSRSQNAIIRQENVIREKIAFEKPGLSIIK